MALSLAAASLALAGWSSPGERDRRIAPTAALAAPPAGEDVQPPDVLDWQVVSRRPHDEEAFTQGLVLSADGRLFESTGLLGRSTLREIDPLSGAVLRRAALPEDHFGEGLALVGDHLIQLTWRNGVAHVWEADTFEPVRAHGYEGEGWGLCHDGRRLVMSDGSERLVFRDAETFAILAELRVRGPDGPEGHLNELECAGGSVWANVYRSDTIVRIDPDSGRVTGRLDLDGLLLPHPGDARPGAVLNGIAHDPVADTFLVTGKLWPELIEIRVAPSERGQPGFEPVPGGSAGEGGPD